MKAKIVCPVNIGFNEYQDKLIGKEIEVPSDIEAATKVVKCIMGAMVKTAQQKRWGIAARLFNGNEFVCTVYEGA